MKFSSNILLVTVILVLKLNGIAYSDDNFSKKINTNVIIIYTDELRWDALGFMNNDFIKTPNIDQLSSESIIFNNAFCVSPLCGPSRYAFITGKYPNTTGKLTNKPFDFVAETEFSFTKLLTEKGYILGHAGKNDTWNENFVSGYFDYWEEYRHHGKEKGAITSADAAVRSYFLDDPRHGEAFDKAPMMLEGLIDEPAPFDVEDWPTYRLTSDAIEFVKKNKDNKFFLHLSYPGPHWPQVCPEPFFSMYDPEKIPNLEGTTIDWETHPFKHFVQSHALNFDEYSHDEIKKLIAVYWGQISLIDAQIGRFINSLKEEGLYNNSIIVFTSDHGDFGGRYGLVTKTGGFYEPLVRIPLTVKIAGDTRTSLSEANVSNIDVMPTIMDLLNIEYPEIDGKSFINVLNGDDTIHREAVFAEVGSGIKSPLPVPFDTYKDYHNRRSKEDGMFWFIEYTVADKAIMIRKYPWKYVFYRDDIPELYNLENDPLELTNLAGNKDFKDVILDLQVQLFKWYLE